MSSAWRHLRAQGPETIWYLHPIRILELNQVFGVLRLSSVFHVHVTTVWTWITFWLIFLLSSFFFFLQHPDFPILWKIWVNYLVQWILILVLILVLIQMWIGILDRDHFLGWTRLKKCSTDFDLDTNALTQLGSYIQAETVLLLHSVDMYCLDHLGG